MAAYTVGRRSSGGILRDDDSISIVAMPRGGYVIRLSIHPQEPVVTAGAPESLDDISLMRAVAAGDSRALKVLYDRHSGIVYTLACRMLRDVHDAEQLLTDVFYEIWNARERYDETRANPLTYLTKLTRSRAIDRMRRRRPLGSARASVPLDPAAGIDVTVQDGPSAVEAEDDRAKIRKALSILDPDHRAIIECAYFDGLSHSEIASRLNKPLGTVKSSIRLGLAHLRDLLSTQGRIP
jgi:RNA polymerase sigma-70 factor (ECF subfamily)